MTESDFRPHDLEAAIRLFDYKPVRVRTDMADWRGIVGGPGVKKKRVYLAGPMRGLPQNNFPAFYKAAAMLELWGYEVVNPARMDIDEGRAEFNWNLRDVILDNSFTIEHALARDYDEIRKCDAIVLLPGWEKSEGAAREIAFSVSRGLKCFRYNEDDPLNIEAQEPIRMVIELSCMDLADRIAKKMDEEIQKEREKSK